MKTSAIVILTLLPLYLFSQKITVGTTGDYSSLALAAPHATAGDTIEILDEVFSDGTQFIYDLNGTANDRIFITAQNDHQAIFRGGTEAIHLVNCSYVVLHGLVIEQQTGNGVNIDDGGDYSTPSHHISIINCVFRDMAASGNNDFLKLSGLDSFLVKNCSFTNGGGGGSGIDMVGCHWGTIEDNIIDNAGVTGIQAKGGTQHIRMQRNTFIDLSQRAINLGGSTGFAFFRPPLPDPIVDAFEAADLEVYSNVFIGSWAPIAYVGCVRVKVYNNTIYKPGNWVIRILQETTEPGFLTCADNEFRNNIVYLAQDLTEVNIGPNTDPGSFIFTNNLWYNESDGNWSPTLPVLDSNQVIADPQFVDAAMADFAIDPASSAVQMGKILQEPTHDFLQHTYFDPPSIGAFEGHVSITQVRYHIRDQCISMGPNPFTDQVVIDGDFSNAMIQILDGNGTVVQDLSNASSPLTIDLGSLPNGLYFLSLHSVLHSDLCVVRILKGL